MDDDFGLVPQISDAPLNLTRDEQLRMVSLIAAINLHKETALSDAGMYQALKLDGHTVTPLTDQTIINSAVRFELFIRCGENPKRMALIEEVADGLNAAIAEEGAEEDGDGS
jgi:hypothetical protein